MRHFAWAVLLIAAAGCDSREREAAPESAPLTDRLAWCRASSARASTNFCLDAEREEERRFLGRGGKSVADSFEWGASAGVTGREAITPAAKAKP